jgi:hypothetical protein
LPQAVQTNRGSTSDSRTSSAQRSATSAIVWRRKPGPSAWRTTAGPAQPSPTIAQCL